MKQINLLPASVRKTQAIRSLIVGGVLGVLVGTGGAGLMWGSLELQVNYIQDKVADTEHNQQLVASQVAAAQKEELLTDSDLQTRVTQINALSKTEVKWSRAFQLVNAITPQDITLTGIQYQVGTEPAQIALTGQAPSNFSFAVLVESLRKQDSISEVEVKGYTFDPTTSAVTFSLVLNVPLKHLDYSSSI